MDEDFFFPLAVMISRLLCTAGVPLVHLTFDPKHLSAASALNASKRGDRDAGRRVSHAAVFFSSPPLLCAALLGGSSAQRQVRAQCGVKSPQRFRDNYEAGVSKTVSLGNMSSHEFTLSARHV